MNDINIGTKVYSTMASVGGDDETPFTLLRFSGKME